MYITWHIYIYIYACPNAWVAQGSRAYPLTFGTDHPSWMRRLVEEKKQEKHNKIMRRSGRGRHENLRYFIDMVNKNNIMVFYCYGQIGSLFMVWHEACNICFCGVDCYCLTHKPYMFQGWNIAPQYLASSQRWNKLPQYVASSPLSYFHVEIRVRNILQALLPFLRRRRRSIDLRPPEHRAAHSFQARKTPPSQKA